MSLKSVKNIRNKHTYLKQIYSKIMKASSFKFNISHRVANNMKLRHKSENVSTIVYRCNL